MTEAITMASTMSVYTSRMVWVRLSNFDAGKIAWTASPGYKNGSTERFLFEAKRCCPADAALPLALLAR